MLFGLLRDNVFLRLLFLFDGGGGEKPLLASPDFGFRPFCLSLSLPLPGSPLVSKSLKSLPGSDRSLSDFAGSVK